MEDYVAGKDPILSAEVVLKPQSGKPMENAAITAETVKAFAPSADAVREAQRYFADAGFNVGGLSGISFTISAPKSVFERAFGTKIEHGPLRSAAVKGKAKAANELPLNRLRSSLRRHVSAVTFSPPMDFGPTGSFHAG
jgi:subtilase family serine protease